ncbi:hypothetical protein [Salicibibacter kimchii]
MYCDKLVQSGHAQETAQREQILKLLQK